LVARPERTEPVLVCIDSDVVITELLSRAGASRAILVLGELGLLRLVLPAAAVEEVRKNLVAKLPEAAPLFEEFLRAVPVQIHLPTSRDSERARELADAKDVPILAAAIGARAPILVTHNVRHFRSGDGVACFDRERSSRKSAPGWDPSDVDVSSRGRLLGYLAGQRRRTVGGVGEPAFREVSKEEFREIYFRLGGGPSSGWDRRPRSVQTSQGSGVVSQACDSTVPVG
jgi:predicted nucleic acid-binding protein